MCNRKFKRRNIMYKFRIATESEADEAYRKYSYGGEHIYGAGVGGEEVYALFLGKVITLFGKPDNLSDDWECMYSIDVTAEDENGNKLVLEVYHGPGGPSISTPIKLEGAEAELYEKTAKELVKYIESAEPADYEWESVYYDIPVNVKYTVKDGKAGVDSEFGEDFDPEELM